MSTHPDAESLFRYWEGEVADEDQKAIDRHLSSCQECRLEYQKLVDAWVSVEDRAAPVNLIDNDNDQLAGLLAGIQDWQATAAKAGRTDEGVKRRVAGHVEKYLGTPGTSKVLESVSDDGGNLLCTVEPVLALFLGKKAAANLVNHVVDVSIVRI